MAEAAAESEAETAAESEAEAAAESEAEAEAEAGSLFAPPRLNGSLPWPTAK